MCFALVRLYCPHRHSYYHIIRQSDRYFLFSFVIQKAFHRTDIPRFDCSSLLECCPYYTGGQIECKFLVLPQSYQSSPRFEGFDILNPTVSIFSSKAVYRLCESTGCFSPFGSSVPLKQTITTMLPVGSVHDAIFGSFSLRPSSLLAFRLTQDIYTRAFNRRIARSSCQV
jgi:hypothetical protein